MREVVVNKGITNGMLARLTGSSIYDVESNTKKYLNQLKDNLVDIEVSNKAYELIYVLEKADLKDTDGNDMTYSGTVKSDLMKILVAMADYVTDKETIIVPITTSSTERRSLLRKYVNKTKISPKKDKVSPRKHVNKTKVVSKEITKTCKGDTCSVDSEVNWEYIANLMKLLKKGKNVPSEAIKALNLSKDIDKAINKLYKLLYNEYNNATSVDFNIIRGLAYYYNIKIGKKDKKQLIEAVEFKCKHPNPYEEDFDTTAPCCESGIGYTSDQYKYFMKKYGLTISSNDTKLSMHEKLTDYIKGIKYNKRITKILTKNKLSPTRDTSSPTKSKLSPTRDTSSPTKSKLSPTRDTSSPTRDTSSPTRDTSSPIRDNLDDIKDFFCVPSDEESINKLKRLEKGLVDLIDKVYINGQLLPLRTAILIYKNMLKIYPELYTTGDNKDIEGVLTTLSLVFNRQNLRYYFEINGASCEFADIFINTSYPISKYTKSEIEAICKTFESIQDNKLERSEKVVKKIRSIINKFCKDWKNIGTNYNNQVINMYK